MASTYNGLGFLVDLTGLEKGVAGGGPVKVNPLSGSEAGTDNFGVEGCVSFAWIISANRSTG